MAARLPTHNDLPTGQDTLGRERLVQRVAREIATGDPPLVFGVHGDWGAGKTSFLCQLEHELTEQCSLFPKAKPRSRVCSDITDVFTVWFEAWRYQYEPSPIVALLHEICRQLPRHKKIYDGLKKWGTLMTRGFFAAVDELSLKIEAKPLGTGGEAELKLKNPIEAIEKARDAWDEEHLSGRLTTDHVRRQLQEAIAKLLGNERRRVCVIIDDLDRCDPTGAFRLLEGIKIHFSLSQCIFVLGVNIRQIELAIAPLLPGADQKADSIEKHTEAAEYLEKLCSFTWKLPFLSPAARSSLLRLGLANPPEAKVEETTPLPEALIAKIATVAETYDCLPANPRKIKGLANSIRQLAEHGWHDEGSPGMELAIPDSEAETLLIAAAIYHFHPELLRYLQTSKSAWIEVLNWINGKSALPGDSDLLKFLMTLRFQSQAMGDTEKSATPGGVTRASMYADPTHLNVLRIENLVRTATDPSFKNSVTYDSIRRYLDLQG
ncbi:MAG: AAA family ATPase [Verrucomicrobia bacterium]|nr:AAA family ATPase [Verrucomicrobiota bacterium]